ncbi:50S ribosomal protein L7/L12 [Candidatus Phytoplasma australiense]|uniref:Large ribosomal subunit protein bL12 n=1 Tax=Phytoplasma australiense TaxID=59748 RepID=RL7_PHYAS|nr:RecName: Full=Large ribosomal subunit protein bL12; AltName: Full=50S ribosomal protein L7/L12 [Candidatus Phytoplasma australiense]CAM12000.1 50S ribosomal protein L7/L12 [Candidatus Phytoplasma australiense]
MAKLTKELFISALKEMSLLEIKELLDGLKEEFGIDPNALAVASAGPSNAPEAEEKTEFTVVMKNFGKNRLPVIKVIREITGLGLLDADKFIKVPDQKVKENVSKALAEDIKAKLEQAGAVIELQ